MQLIIIIIITTTTTTTIIIICSLQTNLHMSLHHQSDILQHHGTTCEELIFSLDIRNALGKSLQKVHLSSGQPDQKDNLMTCLPYVVLLLVTRCL